MNPIADIASGDWVRETRIGTWFLGTWMWRRHVLPGTIADLGTLLEGAPDLGRVLDAGCGQGYAFPLLDRHFRPRHLLGIDIDPDLVERGGAAAAGCACPAAIRVGDVTALDLPDASVDTVFCHQSFHHLARQDAAAREFYRVLAPGGRLLFTESCRSFIFSWWVRLFFRHPMAAQKTADEYIALLRAAGFAIRPGDAIRPYPPWARTDFGLLEALGCAAPETRPVPLVCVVARKPG